MNLKAIASALPGQVIDNEMIAVWSGLEKEFITRKIGVHERRFLADDETGLMLCLQAAERLAAENPDFDPARIGLVIVVTQNPDFTLPHMSALLQDALGLPTSTACFDMALGCSGFVYALSVAKAFMLGEEIAEALIVTCDPYSRILDRGNRDVAGLFGDAATVTWLREDGAGRIGRGDFGTDGRGAQHLMLRTGAGMSPSVRAAGGRVPKDRTLQMNGRAIFNFMMTRAPQTLQTCLERNGLAIADIDWIVLHQASRFLLETLASRLALDPAKVPIVMEKTGNTVSSTVPMVLEGLLKDGQCDGKKVLVSGFGVGLSWASNVIEFGEADD